MPDWKSNQDLGRSPISDDFSFKHSSRCASVRILTIFCTQFCRYFIAFACALNIRLPAICVVLMLYKLNLYMFIHNLLHTCLYANASAADVGVALFRIALCLSKILLCSMAVRGISNLLPLGIYVGFHLHIDLNTFQNEDSTRRVVMYLKFSTVHIAFNI